MDIGAPNGSTASQQELYSRSLADNASQIRYYEEYLEKIMYLSLASSNEVRRVKNTIEDLYKEREELSEKYLKATRDKK